MVITSEPVPITPGQSESPLRISTRSSNWSKPQEFTLAVVVALPWKGVDQPDQPVVVLWKRSLHQYWIEETTPVTEAV